MSETQESNSSSGEQGKEAAPSFRARLIEYFLQNPIKVLSVLFLSSGAFFLLVYFCRIGFMPDMNLESATSLLYAISLLGLFGAAYTALTLVMPGLLLAGAIKFGPGLSRPQAVIVSYSSAALWAFFLGGMFGIYSTAMGWILSAGTFVFALVGCFIDDRKSEQRPSKVKDGDISIEQVSNAGKLKEESNVTKSVPGMSQRHDWWRRPGLAAISIVLVTVVLTVPIMFILVVAMTSELRFASSADSWFLMILLVLSIGTSSVLIADVPKEGFFKSTSVFSIGLLILVLSITGNFSIFSSVAIKVLGQGDIVGARVVVTSKGCQIVNQALGQRVCVEKEEVKFSAICPVIIRSRMGSQVVLEFASLKKLTDEQNHSQMVWIATQHLEQSKHPLNQVKRVILDKSEITGWRPIAGIAEHTAPASSAVSSRVASWLNKPQTPSLSLKQDAEEQEVAKFIADKCGEEESPSPLPLPSPPITNTCIAEHPLQQIPCCEQRPKHLSGIRPSALAKARQHLNKDSGCPLTNGPQGPQLNASSPD